jgi:hypothetical protein
MRRLKNYIDYFKGMMENKTINISISDIDNFNLMESLSIWHDDLISSIGGKEMDIFDTLHMQKKDYEPIGKSPLDLDYLCGSGEKSPDERFINSLASIQLKKSQVQNTDDYETFLNKPCKFMFIYGTESNELENPLYLMIQVWLESSSSWTRTKLYKIEGDSNKFYDKLSSKTIEITDGGDSYTYTTSNGNEWTLEDEGEENDTYKKLLTKQEMQDLVEGRDVKIKII